MVAAFNSYPDAAGIYPLAGYPDCVTLYSPTGPYAGTSVYVVARATVSERLFPRSALAEASAYSRDIRGSQIENLPTSALCEQAVLDVYAPVSA